MNKGKIIFLSMATIAVVTGAAVLGSQKVKQVIASTSNHSKIIENLASTFGLNPEDVETVFEETHDQQIEERLDEAVADGDITEDQKNLILEKRDEVEARTEEINEEKLTSEERRTKMQELHEEIKTWADENDIPPMFIMVGRGMDGMHRMRGFDGMGMGCMED